MNNNILVIEGPDGTGKTSMAREYQQLGYEYRHEGPPPDGVTAFEHYTRQLMSAKGKKVVFDRLHVGELVYGPIMRDGSKLTVEHLRLLNRLLFSLGGLLVFCDCPWATVESNWRLRRKQEYVDTLEKLHRVQRAFTNLRRSEFTDKNSCIYDYTTLDIKRPIPRSVAYLPKVVACADGVVGSPLNKFLLVGERVNAKDSFGYDLAFYSDQRASHYLNECLWEAGYTEPELAFTNVISLAGSQRDLKRLAWLQKVIALGDVAKKACERQGVPYLPAPHPAYWRRFKTNQRAKYVELLRRYREGK